MTPLAVFTRRFELRYSRDARRAQDLTGDLATAVEESALGIRVIKSYGRRPYMLRAFTGDTARLREAELRKVGRWPGSGRCWRAGRSSCLPEWPAVGCSPSPITR